MTYCYTDMPVLWLSLEHSILVTMPTRCVNLNILPTLPITHSEILSTLISMMNETHEGTGRPQFPDYELVLPAGSHPRPCGGVHEKEADSEPRRTGGQKEEKTRSSGQEKETVRGEEEEEGRSRT